MKLRSSKSLWHINAALTAALLLSQPAASTAQQLRSTVQASSTSNVSGVQASSANSFIDSVGVATHWHYTNTPYGTEFPGLEAALLGAGIKHVRDGGASSLFVSRTQELAGDGIKTTLVASPIDGLIPNTTYWSASPAYLLTNFIKNTVGTDAIEAVEMPNEIDEGYTAYRWYPKDTVALSGSSTAANYWVNYIVAFTKDSYSAIKSDPATQQILVLGPAMGIANAIPAGSLFSYVDWGAFHPYPYGGNTSALAQPYDYVSKYFWQTNQPSVNIDEKPYAFNRWAPPFAATTQKPMMATETGYFTGTASGSISETTQAKYVPRLVAEYFRHGIPRTMLYELVDETPDLTNWQSNFGLLRNNLTPKPAFTALSSLLALMKDTGGTLSAPATLNYSVLAQAAGVFNRTQYAHDLLLEKTDGTFYLLLWHEVSNSALVNSAGATLPSTATDLSVPALPTDIKIPAAVQSAILYTYNSSWNLVPSAVAINTNGITVPVGDTLQILKLSTTPISVSVTQQATPGTVSLGAIGTGDWVHWSGANAATFTQKQQPISLIGPAKGCVACLGSSVQAGIPTDFDYLPTFFSWTNTGSTLVATANTAISMSGAGNGITFTAISPDVARQLNVYVGAYSATGKLTVSDQQGLVVYSDASLTGNTSRSLRTYSIQIPANAVVTVNWTVASGSGSVFLAGATMASISSSGGVG